MSIPQAPAPAKLVTGLFMNDKSLVRPLAEALFEKYGQVDLISAWFPFDYTDYYKSEMGAPLFRRMFVFKKMIEQEALPEIKIFTNELELKYSSGGKRRVNIDPGYLLPERFVLATGKNFTHRIYIGQGVYADLTLIYTKGDFHPLPWTYPDYGSQPMITFLKQVRKYI